LPQWLLAFPQCTTGCVAGCVICCGKDMSHLDLRGRYEVWAGRKCWRTSNLTWVQILFALTCLWTALGLLNWGLLDIMHNVRRAEWLQVNRVSAGGRAHLRPPVCDRLAPFAHLTSPASPRSLTFPQAEFFSREDSFIYIPEMVLGNRSASQLLNFQREGLLGFDGGPEDRFGPTPGYFNLPNCAGMGIAGGAPCVGSPSVGIFPWATAGETIGRQGQNRVGAECNEATADFETVQICNNAIRTA